MLWLFQLQVTCAVLKVLLSLAMLFLSLGLRKKEQSGKTFFRKRHRTREFAAWLDSDMYHGDSKTTSMNNILTVIHGDKRNLKTIVII